MIPFRLKKWGVAGCALALAAAALAALTALSSASSAHAAVAGDPLNELRRLVDGGQFEAAFKLADQQTALKGSPHFDFLLGVAAINSGNYPQGVLALERHLAVVPANDRARLELAKGYYELGDTLRARREFEFVLRYDPPKAVQANIQKYLDAMQTREVISARATSRSYLEAGLGHDSNANAGTFNSQINIPAGGLLVPDAASKETGSAFGQVAGGTQWVKRVDSSLAVFAGADFVQKSNQTAHAYDTSNVGAYSGFSLQKGTGLYRMTASFGHLLVDGDKYRNTLSITGEGQYSLGDGYAATGVAQYAELAHAPVNDNRDSHMLTLGGGLQKTFRTAWRPTLGLQLTAAHESNQRLRDDLSRDMLTAKLSLVASPSERLGLSAGISAQQVRYEEADIGFGSKRADDLVALDLGANYLWSRNWLLRAEAQVTDNASNQGLYAYRRNLLGLHARYLF